MKTTINLVCRVEFAGIPAKLEEIKAGGGSVARTKPEGSSTWIWFDVPIYYPGLASHVIADFHAIAARQNA